MRAFASTAAGRMIIETRLRQHFKVRFDNSMQGVQIDDFMTWLSTVEDGHLEDDRAAAMGQRLLDNIRIAVQARQKRLPEWKIREELLALEKPKDSVRQAVLKAEQKQKVRRPDVQRSDSLFPRGRGVRSEEPSAPLSARPPRRCRYCGEPHTGDWSTHSCPAAKK